MPSTVADRLSSLPRKAIAMRGEGDRKSLAVTSEMRSLVGQVIAAAIEHSRLTKQEAAYAMGYEDDQAPVSRWINAVEPPQMARFLSVPALRYGLSVALAELSEGAEIRVVVSFPKAGQR